MKVILNCVSSVNLRATYMHATYTTNKQMQQSNKQCSWSCQTMYQWMSAENPFANVYYDTALHCTLCIAQYGATNVRRTPFNFVPTRPGSQRGDLIYITVVGQLWVRLVQNFDVETSTVLRTELTCSCSSSRLVRRATRLSSSSSSPFSHIFWNGSVRNESIGTSDIQLVSPSRRRAGRPSVMIVWVVSSLTAQITERRATAMY